MLLMAFGLSAKRQAHQRSKSRGPCSKLTIRLTDLKSEPPLLKQYAVSVV